MLSKKYSVVDVVHRWLLNFIIIPAVKKFFNELMRYSREPLWVSVQLPGDELTLRFNEGEQKLCANESNERVRFYLRRPLWFAFRVLMDRRIGLGESFMYGDWDAEPTPRHFIALLIRAKEFRGRNGEVRKWSLSKWFGSVLIACVRCAVALVNNVKHFLRRNTLRGSAANIHEHYDLGNDMFEIFLDRSMTYSCAIFQELPKEVPKMDEEVLYEAQMRKYDAILDELHLKESDSVLEIGCGWGACSIRAVQRFACSWTALTISEEQFKLATERVKNAGLEHKIHLKLLDYRMETGTYDKLVAIEMIEAVGHEFLPKFFSVIRNRLVPGGIACIQGITCPDGYYDRYRRSSDFIKKYIFPGGHLPSEGAISSALPKQLTVLNTSHIGQHYAPTLDMWYSAWMDGEKEITKLGYSKVFQRKWEYYFTMCAALFEYGHIDAVQMTLLRQ